MSVSSMDGSYVMNSTYDVSKALGESWLKGGQAVEVVAKKTAKKPAKKII